ncbi:50S ribosomal protein L24 [Candidatus Pacearchaeota archaeon CG10_big_fil_rev_8_21_14_0_10_35_13]|nr:MAG: 50S ribosomal protein L24 [Candidatus Pacearchaeota archaeon CG10_big_fil_rev_8_21_14_0_10_35_13]
MPRCTFCGKDYEIPRGLTEVDVFGKVRHYCSSKCRKNLRLGRDPRRTKWTDTFHLKKKKALDKESEKAEQAKKTE